MKLIVGLGNVGDKYCFTRHNAGFMAVDFFALRNNQEFKTDKKLKAMIAKFKYNGEDIVVAKPLTFMNLSGEAVQKISSFYKKPKMNGNSTFFSFNFGTKNFFLKMEKWRLGIMI